MERIIVAQREVGIIAPQRDVNHVDALITDRMSICYAFSVRDPETEVGMLTHVDPVGEFSLRRMVRNVSPVLKELGAKNVYVETANVMGRGSKDIFVGGAVEELRANGIEVIPVERNGRERQWRDIGPAYGVVFDNETGLDPFFMEDIPSVFTQAELAALRDLTNWKSFVKDMTRLMLNPSFRLGYTPQYA